MITRFIIVVNRKIGIFDNSNEGFDYNISWTIAIITILTNFIAAYLVCLLQGYFINGTFKLCIVFLIIAMQMVFCIYYFFNPWADYDVEFLGQSISMRSLIISKSFDNALWFSNQFYQTISKPNKFMITSKVEIKWKFLHKNNDRESRNNVSDTAPKGNEAVALEMVKSISGGEVNMAANKNSSVFPGISINEIQSSVDKNKFHD